MMSKNSDGNEPSLTRFLADDERFVEQLVQKTVLELK